jgi:hypothetical protein
VGDRRAGRASGQGCLPGEWGPGGRRRHLVGRRRCCRRGRPPGQAWVDQQGVDPSRGDMAQAEERLGTPKRRSRARRPRWAVLGAGLAGVRAVPPGPLRRAEDLAVGVHRRRPRGALGRAMMLASRPRCDCGPVPSRSASSCRRRPAIFHTLSDRFQGRSWALTPGPGRRGPHPGRQPSSRSAGHGHAVRAAGLRLHHRRRGRRPRGRRRRAARELGWRPRVGGQPGGGLRRPGRWPSSSCSRGRQRRRRGAGRAARHRAVPALRRRRHLVTPPTAGDEGSLGHRHHLRRGGVVPSTGSWPSRHGPGPGPGETTMVEGPSTRRPPSAGRGDLVAQAIVEAAAEAGGLEGDPDAAAWRAGALASFASLGVDPTGWVRAVRLAPGPSAAPARRRHRPSEARSWRRGIKKR